MTIDAVVAQIRFAADEPPGSGRSPVEYAGPRCEPVELSCDLGPEVFGILNRAAVERLILIQTPDVRLRGKLCRRGNDSVLVQDRTQIGMSRAGFHCFYSSFVLNDGYDMGSGSALNACGSPLSIVL